MEILTIRCRGIMSVLQDWCSSVKAYILAAVSSRIRTQGQSKVISLNGAKDELDQRARFYLEEYGDSMLRLAYSYVHNYADSEDIIQDAIIKMLTAGVQFENKTHEKSYLMTIVSNMSKNKIKFNKIRETDELSEELISEEKQDLAFVWEATKRLPEKYREVIHLFYYEGYSTSEIATILHANENTVRSNLSRARSELKNVLKEEYDFGEI